MTKAEFQTTLAEATQTDKRTTGVFLNRLSNLAFKEIKKSGEFVLPGFGKLVRLQIIWRLFSTLFGVSYRD